MSRKLAEIQAELDKWKTERESAENDRAIVASFIRTADKKIAELEEELEDAYADEA